MTVEIPKLAVPGQLLTPTHQSLNSTITRFTAGPGTTTSTVSKLEVIISTLLGRVPTREISEHAYEVSVLSGTSGRLPQEGDRVLVRVVRLSLKQAYVEIVALEGSGTVPVDSGIGSNGSGVVSAGGGSGGLSLHASDLGETFKGIIRSQDVRSTERDRVKVVESFKAGDIVRAEIISLGDGTNYYLTTAKNDLGVVFARSRSGDMMYALDWQTMVCPRTGEMEARKCAKPVQ